MFDLRKDAIAKINKLIEEREKTLATDVEQMKKYQAQIRGTTDPARVFNDTLGQASKSAQDQAEALRNGTMSAEVYEEQQKKIIASTQKINTSSRAAAVGMKALSVAMNVGVMLLVSEALNLIIQGIDNLVHADEKAIEKSKEISTAWKEQADTLRSNKQTIDEISEEYESLAKGVNKQGENISLSTEEYSRYNEIVNRVAEMFPTMVQGYNDEGQAILKHKGDIEALTQAYKEQEKAAQRAILEQANNKLNGFKSKVTNHKFWEWDSHSLEDQRKSVESVLKMFEEEDYAGIQRLRSNVNSREYDALQEALAGAGIKDGYFLMRAVSDDVQTDSLDKLRGYYQTLISEINAETSELTPITEALFNKNADFDKLSEETKNSVQQIISQLTPDFYEQNNDTAKIRAWVNGVVSQLKGENGEEIQKALNEAFSLRDAFEKQEINSGDYTKKLEPLRQQILDVIDPKDEYQLKFSFDESLESVDRLKSSIINIAGSGVLESALSTLKFDELKEFDRQLKQITEDKGNVKDYAQKILQWKTDTSINSFIETNQELLSRGEISYASYNKKLDEFAAKLGLTGEAYEWFLGIFGKSLPPMPDLNSLIDNYQDKIKSTKEMLEKLKNSTLTGKEVMDFMQANPNLDWSGVDFSDANFGNLKEILQQEARDGIYRGIINSVEDSYGILIQQKQELEEKYKDTDGNFKSDSDKRAFEEENSVIDDQIKLLDKRKSFLENDYQSLPNIDVTSLSASLDTISNKTSILSTAWKEMSDAGELSAGTIARLVEMHPSLISVLDVENGKVTINRDLLVQSAKDIIIAEKTKAQAVIEDCKQQITALQETANASIQTAKAFVESASYIALANGAAGLSGKMYAEQMKSVANSKIDIQGTDEINQRLTEAAQELKVLDVYLKQLDTPDPFRILSNSVKDLSSQLSSAKSAIDNLLSMTISMIKQDYADQREALQDQLDGIRDKYEAEKEGIEEVQKAQKKANDDAKKALQDQLDGYRKIIQAQIDLLREKENQHDYERGLNEKQSDVGKIQNQLDALQYDDSAEAKAKRLELMDELQKKQDELDEYQHDHSIEIQEDALNKELKSYEDKMQSQMDALDEEADRMEEIHRQRLDQIEAQYQAETERIQREIEENERAANNEAAVRAQAIALIEGRSGEFYNRLLEKPTAPLV